MQTRLGQRLGLGGTSNAESRRYGAEGIETGQRFAVEAVANDIHGAADMVAFGIPPPIEYTQIAFRIGGGHAQHASEPAPQHGAGPSQGNSRGHTDDIAGSQCCRQGGGQCAEGGDAAVRCDIFLGIGRCVLLGGRGIGDGVRRFICMFRTQRHTDGPADMTLGHMQMNGKVQMNAQKQEQQGPVPQKLVDGR